MSNPEWVKRPRKTGAYWFSYCGIYPDICWYHNNMLYFIPIGDRGYVNINEYQGDDYSFYGPLNVPNDENGHPFKMVPIGE